MKQVSTPLLLARFCVWRVHRLQFWTTRTLHGFQFLQLLLLHLRVFLCLSLILFLQFLFHKQNVRHKECKSLHLQQRTTPYISAVKNLCELCFLFSVIRYRHHVVIVENPSIASHLSSIDRVMSCQWRFHALVEILSSGFPSPSWEDLLQSAM